MKHVGTVGERLVLALKCKRVYAYPGGVSVVYFRDKIGNEFRWTTRANPPEVGETHTYRATVKAHAYLGKQAFTKLSRVAPLREIKLTHY